MVPSTLNLGLPSLEPAQQSPGVAHDSARRERIAIDAMFARQQTTACFNPDKWSSESRGSIDVEDTRSKCSRRA